MELKFSLIIPVYNRPQEIEELLYSCTLQTYQNDFEIIIVEDGSEEKCDIIIKKYENHLNIKYLFKENSGAGVSRNYGMEHAFGNYFIILDSDVLLPTHYLEEVFKTLTHNFTDAFGGPDAAHES
ncbi:MAG: glycosyltransferase family 2 protein, partial [Flavobacteriaceae bacterium]|nr:glycosyltransferase family 2 protein [Flavobacteriaceae bacterium]